MAYLGLGPFHLEVTKIVETQVFVESKPKGTQYIIEYKAMYDLHSLKLQLYYFSY